MKTTQIDTCVDINDDSNVKNSELDEDLRKIHVLKTVSGVNYHQLVLTDEQFEIFLNKKPFILSNEEEIFSLSTKKEDEECEIGELVRL